MSKRKSGLRDIVDFIGHAASTITLTKRLSDLLTISELNHVRLLAEGLSNREIAQQCCCSPEYIDNKLSLIYRKVGESGAGSPRVRLALRYALEEKRKP